MARLKQNTLCCKISIKVSTCNVNILVFTQISTWYYMNVYSFNYSIVTFFLNPGASEFFKKLSSTNLVFYWIEDSKTYAHADA